MEWSEPVCSRLWKQRVNTQAGQALEATAVGSKWTWPKESEVSQNDRPQQGNHWRPKIRTHSENTTALQNGHISFIYLYPNKLTHIEYNLFFFVRVDFWYFNNLECANWIDGILKWLLTLKLHADHCFTWYYNLHICLCKISTLVFLSDGRESCWHWSVWIKPKLGCHFLCVTTWKGLSLRFRRNGWLSVHCLK